MPVFENESELEELQLNETVLTQVKRISDHPLAYAAWFQVASAVAATGYAISKKISFFQALEALDEEIIIPYYFPLPDDFPVYEPTAFVEVPLNQLMEDIEFGEELLHFAAECLSRLTFKFVSQGADSLQFESDDCDHDNYEN